MDKVNLGSMRALIREEKKLAEARLNAQTNQYRSARAGGSLLTRTLDKELAARTKKHTELIAKIKRVEAQEKVLRAKLTAAGLEFRYGGTIVLSDKITAPIHQRFNALREKAHTELRAVWGDVLTISSATPNAEQEMAKLLARVRAVGTEQ